MKNIIFRAFLIILLTLNGLNASAQNLADRRVSIIFKDLPTYTALSQVEKAAGVSIVADNQTLPPNTGITLNYKNTRLETIIKDLAKQLDVQYVFKRDMIVLIPTYANPVSVSDWVMIEGQVTDEAGDPLVGVSVFSSIGNTGTGTNADGRFKLRVKEQDMLIVSYIGYRRQSFYVTAKLAEKPMHIELEPDNLTIDEVVVTGYGTYNKNRYVGAISTVNVDDLKIAGEMTIDQMLQGAVAGMAVTTTSGQAGSSSKIRVRGTSTLLGNQEPLWVVDGIIQYDPFPMQEGDNALSGDVDNLRQIAGNCISWLNPNDIETLSVLKDASATAIYGSKAANGVIVITTKKAKAGRTAVSYSGQVTIGQRPSYGLYDRMNSQQKMQLSKEIYDERLTYPAGTTPIGYQQLIEKLEGKQITFEEYVNMFRRYEYVNTDWFDILFRNSVSQSHNIGITGGNRNITNRTSLRYEQTDGEARGNDVKMYSFNSNTTFNFGSRVTLSIGLNGSNREATGYAYGVDPFTYAYNTARTIPAFNEDGSLYYHAKKATNGGNQVFHTNGTRFFDYNIMNEMDNTGSSTNTKKLSANADLRIKIIDGLEFNGVYSYSAASSEQRKWAGERSFYIAQIRDYNYGDPRVIPGGNLEASSFLPHGGLLDTQSMSNRNYTFRNSLIYNRTFNKVHALTLNAGIEVTSEKSTGFKNLRYGYNLDRGLGFAQVTAPSFQYGSTPMTSSTANRLINEMATGSGNTDRENNFLSEYITAVYGYDGRYIVNFNFRMDASNRFGQDENKKFRPTWSLGAKWRAANEKFMSDQTLINALDFSASYGYQGNVVETISPYLIANDLGIQNTGQWALGIASLPYPDLGWEKTHSWNVGADISLFDGRLAINANIYGKSSDVLSGRHIPAENGVASSPVFGTKMKNSGYDITISVTPIRTRDFRWILSLNTGVTKNRLNQKPLSYTLTDFTSGTALVDGYAYGTLWSFAFNGLDHETGKPLFKCLDIASTEDYTKFLVNSGSMDPKFTGGLFTRFNYKGIWLQGNFSMSFGSHKRLPKFYEFNMSTYGLVQPEENSSVRLFNRWRQPGDELHTIYPSMPDRDKATEYVFLPTSKNESISPYEAYNLSDIRVAKGDFIRCRQISIGYDFQRGILKALHMSHLSINASMTNPFLITFDRKWHGYDPETAGWPARKTYSISLNVTF